MQRKLELQTFAKRRYSSLFRSMTIVKVETAAAHHAAPQGLGEGAPAERSAEKPALRRVLHVINGEHYSGAERVQDLLALNLPEFGYQAGFACVKPDRFPKQRRAQLAPLHDLGMRSRLDLRAAWRLARIVRQEGWELLHAHTPRSGLVARLAAALTGVPLVYHVHSPTARDSTRRWRNRTNAWTERASLKRAAGLICVSHTMAEQMRRDGYSSERVCVVHNGVPVVEAAAPRTRRGERWTLGMVALFRPRKGTEVLLDALAMLRKDGLDVSLRAVGPFETPGYEREIKDRVARLGIGEAIEWRGFQSDINAELAAMDLFVLPSLFGEGLPMVVLEAMAVGLPVVATRVEGTPEAVRDRLDGVLAEPNDSGDLATAIERIARGKLEYEQLSRSALQRQQAEFSDRHMAAGVAAAYERVLAARRK